MLKRIRVQNKYIGEDDPVFIIAEIGSNHNQDINIAKKLIDVAAEAGVDAVKFQLFSSDKLYKPGDELYQVFKDIELNPEWISELIDYSNSRSLIFFASPFDEESLEILKKYKVPLYKWASSEATNLKNLRLAASYNKPMIISTGMCDLADIYEALEVCKAAGNDNIVLLHTSSLYPTDPEDVNLNVMKRLNRVFHVHVGFSDHTMSSTFAVMAVAFGASVIEKHITLDKKMKGPDHFYASEPKEFKQYVQDIREAEAALGSENIEMHSKVRKIARRESIYAKTNIEKGEIIKAANLEVKKPALGISPRYINAVIGTRVKKIIVKNKPITWENIK